MRLIDADVAKKAVHEEFDECLVWDESGEYTSNVIEKILEALPTVDAVPVRQGKWIYGNDFHWYTASCNKCGYQRRTDIKADGWNQWRYCPNCGAKMGAE